MLTLLSTDFKVALDLRIGEHACRNRGTGRIAEDYVPRPAGHIGSKRLVDGSSSRPRIPLLALGHLGKQLPGQAVREWEVRRKKCSKEGNDGNAASDQSSAGTDG